MECIVILWIIQLKFILDTHALNETLVATTQTQELKSHEQYDTQNYPDNYTAEWNIKTDLLNYTIQISITECDVESTSHKGAIKCDWSWDILAFYDVIHIDNKTTYRYIESTCCNGSLDNIRSSGQEMQIRFTTDQSTSRKGFKAQFRSIAPSGSPNAPQASRQDTTSTGKVGLILGILVGVILLTALIIVTVILVKRLQLSRRKVVPTKSKL